ncbi:hypothetical protein C0J52_00689 [Blattella germanica]|nr:hypothetical protein C0J52_00689 [Blattella germanica]
MFTGTVRVKICEACGLRPTDFQKRHKPFGKPDDQPIDPYVSIDVDENHLDRSSTKAKTFDPVWNESFVHDVQSAVNLGLTVFHDAAIPPDDFVANCSIPFEDLVHRDRDSTDFWVDLEPQGRSSYIQASGIQRKARLQQEAWGHETPCASSKWSQIHGHIPPTAHLLLPLPRIHLGFGETRLSMSSVYMCGPQALPSLSGYKMPWLKLNQEISSGTRFNVNIPHRFVVHNYKRFTFCDHCGSLLYGLFRQGLQCEACSMNVHKRCQKNVANNCGINTKEMAQILAKMGISTDKLGPPRSKANKSGGSTSSVPSGGGGGGGGGTVSLTPAPDDESGMRHEDTHGHTSESGDDDSENRILLQSLDEKNKQRDSDSDGVVWEIRHKFMTKNPAKRLGCVAAHGTEAAIRNHPFFRDMDWEALEARRVKPPFKPKIKSKKDALNFDAEFTKEDPVLTPVNADVVGAINQDEFRGFSFVNPDFNPGRYQADKSSA